MASAPALNYSGISHNTVTLVRCSVARSDQIHVGYCRYLTPVAAACSLTMFVYCIRNVCLFFAVSVKKKKKSLQFLDVFDSDFITYLF